MEAKNNHQRDVKHYTIDRLKGFIPGRQDQSGIQPH